jgi:hypothetical protein
MEGGRESVIKPFTTAHEAMKEDWILRIVREKFEEWESQKECIRAQLKAEGRY